MSDALHLVCPSCHGVNRIAAARLTDSPRCGHCHQPLFNGHPVELDSASFPKHIGRSDIPVVVDFWAPWCGPCRSMAPHFEQAAADLSPGVQLARLNTDSAQDIAGQYGIRSIPTMILFRRGREVARQSGALGKEDILRWVRSHG